jgi:TRAP-type C4-dicarboxylate transport system substrate-binding protein
LTLTSINAPGHWSEVQGHTPFMACVKEGTNGGIDFKYFHSGSLATVPTALEVLNKGVAQISFVVPSGISDKMPISNVPLLPGMGDNVVNMVKAFRTVANNPESPFAKEFVSLGIKPLILNVFPPYQVMARKEAIKTMDGFKNKKIRVAGGAQSFGISAMGAVPVTIGFGEIYIAMQQGTVDAFIFSSMTVKDFSLQEVTKAMSRNGNFGTAVGVIAIDQKAYDKLPPAQQKVLVDCGLKTEDHLAKYAREFEGKLFDEFAKGGVDVYNFDAQTKSDLARKNLLAQADFVLRLERRGLPGQKAFDEYRKALGN